jgi:hypothetical protein
MLSIRLVAIANSFSSSSQRMSGGSSQLSILLTGTFFRFGKEFIEILKVWRVHSWSPFSKILFFVKDIKMRRTIMNSWTFPFMVKAESLMVAVKNSWVWFRFIIALSPHATCTAILVWTIHAAYLRAFSTRIKAFTYELHAVSWLSIKSCSAG